MVTEGKYTDIIGKKVHVIVDRPAGSYHPRNHEIFYPINYGYIEDIIAGDGSGQDVYIIGQDNPLETFDGIVIAVYHRTNDVEDKWILYRPNPKSKKVAQTQSDNCACAILFIPR